MRVRAQHRTRGEQGGDRPRDEEHASNSSTRDDERGVPIDDALTVGVIGPIGSSRVRALGRHDDEERRRGRRGATRAVGGRLSPDARGRASDLRRFGGEERTSGEGHRGRHASRRSSSWLKFWATQIVVGERALDGARASSNRSTSTLKDAADEGTAVRAHANVHAATIDGDDPEIVDEDV